MMELAPEQQSLLEWVRRKWDAADTTHRRHREQWDRWDALYHSRRSFLQSHSDASPRDRDGIVRDAQIEFGADLLIPYAFSVVETVLPRMLSNRPRMLITPRNPASEKNVDSVRIVMDAQQHKSDYELKLQTTGRSGLIYGLGVQKVFWRREVAKRKVQRKRLLLPGYAEAEVETVLWDDPDCEDVSVYDFLWDPYGDNMQTVGWVFHRSWRSRSYVLGKVKSGAWDGVPDLSDEELEAAGGKARYTEVWKPRWDALGQRVELKEPIHEVWEYHDGAEVITVVDRKWPVSRKPNPAWHGRMPFHVWRPTEVQHQFCGKGEIEPVEDLSREMNMLRTDRRWNALFKLHQAHFFEEGSLDPEDVKIGPGSLIPVRSDGSSLRDLIVPVTVGDIPNSSYQEELALQQDIERVSGISDSVSGGNGANQTATGVQLLQAAAGMRIQFKTRRIELELIKPAAADWLALNQQRITDTRHVGVPALPTPDEPERRYTWRQIGPEEMAGEFDAEPDGGSTEPENVPQMRQDAQIGMALLSAPGLDSRKWLLWVLERMGVKAPEALLAPDVHVPPQTLDLIAQGLEQAGVDPQMVQQVVGGALNMALDAEAQQQQQQGQGGSPPPTNTNPAPEQAAA